MQKKMLIQSVAAGLSAVLIAALAIGPAGANLPNCSNCIEAGDIDSGAVRASELNNDLDDSITANDIATGAIGAAELNNDLANSITANDIGSGAIGLSELADSITPAIGTVELSGSTGSTTPDTIDTFTVTEPGPGYLLVQVDGMFFPDLEATTAASALSTPDIGLCTAVDSLSAADCVNAATFWYQDADDASGLNHTPFFVLSRVIAIDGAGTTTLYLNGDADSASDPIIIHDYARATVIFAPGTLTIS